MLELTTRFWRTWYWLLGADLDTTRDPAAWRRVGHTCEREVLDGAKSCAHLVHRRGWSA